MELRHLRYFVAVAESKSFTQAAERLFIAQPPLSRQIQQLEAEIGVQLFERSSRPLQLTEAGHFFYQHALKLLSNVEEIKSMTTRIGIVERSLKIGFVASLLYGLLSKIIYVFRQQQPNLKIELIEMTTSEQVQALKQGKIDVGFGRLRISDPHIKRILLREEPLVLAVHQSHPLAQQTSVTLAEIEQQPLFVYPNTQGANFAHQVQAILAKHALTPKNIKVVREIQLALGLVAASEGVCIVPQSAKSIQLAHVHYIPITDHDAVSPVFMAVRQLDQDEDLRALFDCIYQVYDLEAIKYERKVF